ncbi:MAG: hypothetical protein WKF86_09020 [Acidimicrobiales bacterium]
MDAAHPLRGMVRSDLDLVASQRVLSQTVLSSGSRGGLPGSDPAPWPTG